MDSDLSPEDIIKYAKSAGLDAIAVTDHNSIEGGKKTEKLAGRNLIVFAGSEINTEDGEIIGLNLKRDVQPGLSIIETCNEIKRQAGFIIVPHPFDRFRRGIGNAMEKIMDYIDAVEVFNARTLVGKFNKDSQNFTEKHGLPFVAGSDAHFRQEIGSAYVIVESEKNKDAIMNAIKNGKAKVSGRKTGINPHWKTFVTKMGKRF